MKAEDAKRVLDEVLVEVQISYNQAECDEVYVTYDLTCDDKHLWRLFLLTGSGLDHGSKHSVVEVESETLNAQPHEVVSLTKLMQERADAIACGDLTVPTSED